MNDRKERLTARLEALRAAQQAEQTTSGNAGAYQVPLGGVQRDVFPNAVVGKKGKKKKDRKNAIGAIDRYEIPPGYAGILTRAEEQLERLRS